jgi:hypothetical protein
MSNLEKYRKMSEELKGKRVRCINMNDEHPIESGEEGTVDLVDDMGTIHVKWDNGRRIGLVPEEDSYEVLP